MQEKDRPFALLETDSAQYYNNRKSKGIWSIARELMRPYSTVHDWLVRMIRCGLGDPERRQAAGQMSRTDMPVSLLEPTDHPSRGQQNINVRQGRNLRSPSMTDILHQIPVDASATPAVTSVCDRSFRPTCGRVPCDFPGYQSCTGNCRTASRR